MWLVALMVIFVEKYILSINTMYNCSITDGEGWMSGKNGYRYKIINAVVQHRFAALMCQQEGGVTLGPSLRDPAANEYFRNAVMPMFGNEQVWVSATDSSVEGTWVWSNGEAVEKNLWTDNQPDDNGGQDCAYVTNWGNKMLDDGDCEGTFKVMCEQRRSG